MILKPIGAVNKKDLQTLTILQEAKAVLLERIRARDLHAVEIAFKYLKEPKDELSNSHDCDHSSDCDQCF